MDLLVTVLSVPLGLVAGSIVTTVADRAPGDEQVLRPGPRCPHCRTPLTASELVPLLSWVRQGGRCGHCSARLSLAYPVVEAVTAVLFLAAALRFGETWEVVVFWFLYAALVAVSVVDLGHYRIPDRINLPALGISFLGITAVSLGYSVPEAIGRALVGAVAFTVLLLVMHIVSPRAMGFGDVKLAPLLGLHIGWLGGDTVNTLTLIFICLFISAAVALAGGGVLIAARRSGHDLLPDPEEPRAEEAEPGTVAVKTYTSLPFGPALATATVVVTLFARQLLEL